MNRKINPVVTVIIAALIAGCSATPTKSPTKPASAPAPAQNSIISNCGSGNTLDGFLAPWSWSNRTLTSHCDVGETLGLRIP